MESREFVSQNIDRAEHMENVELVLKSASQERPDERNFADIYSQSIIERDLEVVHILERKFHENLDHLTPSEMKRVEEGKKRSEALEVIMVEGGELYNWFGEKAFLSRTGKYDDYNGIDGVLELVREEGEDGEQESHTIALAIDASMRPDFSSIKRKIDRNVEKMTGPKKPRVKYFQSAVNGSKKKLTMVLPVVVGVEGKHAEELTDLFGEVIRLRAVKDKTEPAKKLLKEKLDSIASHPAQVIFLQEITDQLNGYAALFAKGTDHDSVAYSKKAKELSGVISEIIETKMDINPGKYIDDGVFLAIEAVSKEIAK
jgi:hypothetical protein